MMMANAARSGIGLLLGSLIALVSGEASAASRTVLYDGKIFTSEQDASFAQAIAIQDNHILAVGSNDDVLALVTQDTTVVDLGGRTVVPGLNDAHVHVLGSPGVYLNGGDFIPGPGPNLDDVKALIAQGASQTPPGTWLIVLVGEAIFEDPSVDRFALDTVSPDHPVKLEAWSGHGTYLNTKGLSALGIAEDAPDPFGGGYERYPGTNILTGVAHEYAEYQIRRRMLASISDEEVAARYQAYASTAVQLGFTSIQDMAVGLPRNRSLAALAQADLPIRVRSICFPLTPGESCAASPSTLSNFVSATGIKWITDGTPIERRAYLNASYTDKPNWMGEFNFPENALLWMTFRGLLGTPRNNQLLFHTIGDGAIDTVLDALDATGGPMIWKGRRTRMEHGDLLFPENIERVKFMGMVVVQNPTHLAIPQMFYERFGPDRFFEMQPLGSLVDAGIPLALGTDGIGQVSSPWVDILLAAIHPTRPTEALSVEEAVRAYTLGSAYAEFAEKQKGSLTPGKLADLAVLSQDVFSASLYALPATYSVLTMVDGQVVWSTGELGL